MKSTENQYRVTISSLLFQKCTVIDTDGTVLAKYCYQYRRYFKVPSAQLCLHFTSQVIWRLLDELTYALL